MNQKKFPEAIEMEKQLLSAMFMKEGLVVPDVAAIIDANDFYRSSFNRDNYTKPVSFESFKESGNIEYTADVVWALQLFVINSINSFNISDARQKIDKAKKKQPRQIQLKCLKNRQGTNYDCFFNYFSAHDCFTPCEKFGDDDEASDNSSSNNKRNNKL